MAQGRNTLMDPPIEDLLDKVDSKFTLVALGSARARQVNSYYNSLGEGLGKVVPPQVASVSGKPVSIAFEEIAAGKATYTRPDPEEEAALAAAAEAELAGEMATDVVLTEVLTEVLADDEAAVEAQVEDEIVDDLDAGGLAGGLELDQPVAEAEIEVLDVGDEDPTAS
jgi:DNA-directed RNA polymerase subunit omega